jgi:hypothetical protein
MTNRQEQIREATARHRKRHKRGLFLRPISMTKSQLDELEVRGYLDPNNRGDRADECEAIETFLMDSLAKAT